MDISYVNPFDAYVNLLFIVMFDHQKVLVVVVSDTCLGTAWDPCTIQAKAL